MSRYSYLAWVPSADPLIAANALSQSIPSSSSSDLIIFSPGVPVPLNFRHYIYNGRILFSSSSDMIKSPANEDSGASTPSVKPKQEQKDDVGDNLTSAITSGVSKPRSRSGCNTCKAKHLKCDETKPVCLVCTRKGWTCGGYKREFRWSYKHERKTKDGGRGKNKARGKQKQQPGHQRARTLSSSNSESEFSLGSLPMDFTADSQLPMLSEALPELPIIDYGWDAGEPTSVISQAEIISPVQNTEVWSPGRPSTDLIVPILEQPEVQDSELPDDVEILPDTDAGTNLALASAIQNFEYSTQIPVTITHLPSVLITQWFKSVCGVWSAYDSDMNLNRQLATSLWSESESVSACLQSMSASFLATRIPYLRDTSLTMMKHATKSIHNELAVAKSYKFINSIPTGLLFSLFCLGTTLCWIEAGQLGIPFLRAAKSLLDRINHQSPILCDEDGQLLDFFNKSWVYCDMLLSVVSYDYAQFPMEVEMTQGPLTPSAEPKRTDDVPHPWTGISTTASTLFTKAIRLCRSFRHNVRRQGLSPNDVELVLKQMEEAPKIEEQLLQLEYESVVPMGETGDQHTPSIHLVKVAEAYRIAALLQLYQTFPDLVALRIPEVSSASRNGMVPWEEWIVPLSLRLIEILEHIPPESGSRMVQPLLCITASTGLRLDVPANSWRNGLSENQTTTTHDISLGIRQENCDIAEFMDQLDGVGQPAGPPNMPTQLSIDVGNARAFVLNRLNMLENSLPPKPIIMAKHLVQAIWNAYDNEMPGCHSVHWVDVMEQQNLRSFFG
ncbi:hypothetical protein BGZ63DRAFT_453523 [Mariannaea sp. PMI_226]|nr:hypothetical protein BGZ63DRAFT_453523 [Mariannaea sp. PMI_226]